MKKILFFIIVALYVSVISKVSRAQNQVKIIDAKESGHQKTLLSCGEVDSVCILLDPSLSHASLVTYNLNGVSELTLQRLFWRSDKCSFPTNGDINVSVMKIYLFPIAFIIFVCSFILFCLWYFTPSGMEKPKWIVDVVIAGCVIIAFIPWLVVFILESGFLLAGIADFILVFVWLVVFSLKKFLRLLAGSRRISPAI